MRFAAALDFSFAQRLAAGEMVRAPLVQAQVQPQPAAVPAAVPVAPWLAQALPDDLDQRVRLVGEW